MTNNNYTYTLDEESASILKQVPLRKRSEFVREGVKLKAKTLDEPKQAETPKKRVHVVNIH